MAIGRTVVRFPAFFRQPLTRLQAVIGIAAGIISITMALYSTTLRYIRPPIRQGDIIAVIQEAHSQKPVSDATVEIYTLENRLVTTLAPKQQGRARQIVNEGPYKLRVSHPKFMAQVKQVQVQAGQISEVRVALVRPAPPPPPPPPPRVAVEKKVTPEKKVAPPKKESGVRKFFRTLGFD
jgi:hypothetical protein